MVERFFTVVRLYCIVVLQSPPHQTQNLLLIIDNQDPHSIVMLHLVVQFGLHLITIDSHLLYQ